MKILLAFLLLAAVAAAAASQTIPGTCPKCKKTVWLKPLTVTTNGVSESLSDRIIHCTVTLSHRHLLKATTFSVGHDIYLPPSPPLP